MLALLMRMLVVVMFIATGLLMLRFYFFSLPHYFPPMSLPVLANYDTQLGRYIKPLAAPELGKTGVLPLVDGRDAYLARLALVEAAESTIDVQYYIWHQDITGSLLFQRLLEAAERGVKVRLLLDDNNTTGKDAILSALDAHANIEVRLFNPFVQRKYRALGFLTDFFRVNRRMHNKSLTVDGVVSVVGGRNIGDEYFDAASGVVFADLDVAVVGSVVPVISAEFDRYWRSRSSFPLSLIVDVQPDEFPEFAYQAQAQSYLDELAQSPFAQSLARGEVDWHWTHAHLISDDPSKGLGRAPAENSVMASLAPMMEQAETQLTIVSPYFVPTKQGTRLLQNIVKQGAQVAVLTNSFMATDVAPVHAGYIKYRKPLLKKGIALYELKPSATVHEKRESVLKSSGASLHAKTFTIDNQWVFVGSFNMDPRSARLNTEMGLLFESPMLAEMVDQGLQKIEEHAYALSLKNKALRWCTVEHGKQLCFDAEPGSHWGKNLAIRLLAMLPIEWLL